MKKKAEEKRKGRLQRVLYIFVLVSFILPIGYLVARLFSGDVTEGEAGYHTRADYILMIVECLLGIFVIHVPAILAKRFRFELPVALYVMYIVFLYCAIFLGEVRSFYYLIPHWDVFLHGFSGVMTGFFGFMVVTILNRDEHLVVKLSPFFVALFSFCFAVAIGAVWEVYEFVCDGLMALNMQKYAMADGELLVGRAALMDTMKDVIVDICGALIASAAGYFSLKRDRRWFTVSLRSGGEVSAE